MASTPPLRAADAPAAAAAAAAADNPTALPLMLRAYLWVIAAVSLVGAGLLVTAADGHAAGVWAAGLFLGLGLLAMAVTRLPDAWLAATISTLLGAAILSVGAAAVLLGWGLQAHALPLIGLAVCMACLATGWQAGAGLAALAATMVLLIGAFSPGPGAAAGAPPLAVLLGTNLAAIAAGLASGALARQVMQHFADSALEREQRFRRLLALAADAHWEIDDQYRVVTAASEGTTLRAMPHAEGLPRRPWDLPLFAHDDEALDLLQADVEARRAFRDVALRWITPQGRHRAVLASGEPRFDETGRFTGYWGVVRDMTAVHVARAARSALAATESRYQELFALIPTPLVLHRDGIVIDANPAAAGLFGQGDLQALIDTDPLDLYEPGESRERARTLTQHLQAQATGQALPVAGFQLRVQGRPMSVRATSVRVEAEGGPALLTLFVDDTERLAAEDAVQRSEALLAHLVATSPDLIALTELATGRYAMVNHGFERLSGWTAAEAVGRTSLELGVWPTPGERHAFVEQVRRQGSVTDLPTAFVTKAGRPLALRVSAGRFEMDRRDYLLINARDVTESERQQLERDAILANASVGIAVTRQQRFVLANRHFEQIFGWEPGALLGQPAGVVWASAQDYAEVGREVQPRLERGEPIELERTARRHDGSTFLARLRGRAVDPARPAGSGTVWIVEDVTERHQFEQALARARDEAEAGSRAKSAFLANTSHELRTPLNGMIGLARLARDDLTDETRRRQYLDQIVDSAQSLAGVISDILDLSKIESGRLPIESATFDLGALLQTLQRTYATLAVAHGLTLTLQAAPDAAAAVTGDPLRLRQILSNYLSNAVKFTTSGGIALRAWRVGGGATVRLEVQDSGPGIAADVQAHLFEPFTQADQSTTRRFGGTGLGLSICRELATLMEGRVGVESQPGSGSTFWVELPLPPTTAAPPAPPAVTPGSLQGMRVLMAEDNPVNMLIAVAMLERWGVAVTQAGDGREALAAVQRAAAAGRPFDAVLMDVQMPVMGGYEATRALRAADQRLPVIALTAAALVTERDEARRAGMNDFLTKPIDADKLQATLVRWCSARLTSP